MKSEISLVFEENDGTLRWLFNILIYAHHISDPKIRKMLEPMLKEYLHKTSYKDAIKLSNSDISEEELVRDYINNNLLKFNSPTVTLKGAKIKSMCYMIEQAGAMEAAAKKQPEEHEDGEEEVPEVVLNLFRGHQDMLERIRQAVISGLETAGAKGVRIEKFSSE